MLLYRLPRHFCSLHLRHSLLGHIGCYDLLGLVGLDAYDGGDDGDDDVVDQGEVIQQMLAYGAFFAGIDNGYCPNMVAVGVVETAVFLNRE